MAVRGGAPVVFRNPARDYVSTTERVTRMHLSLSGARTLDVTAPRRRWELVWAFLTDAEYDLVLSFLDGRRGVGPFDYEAPDVDGTAVVHLVSLDSRIPTVGYRSASMVLEEV